MEIVVQGKGIEFIKPDQVVLNINFYKKGNTYEEALEKGVANVQNFVNELLLTNGFQVEDLKTRSFRITEEYRYNSETREQIFDGFKFNQSATLKFDYNKEMLANMMVAISKLTDAPNININFGVKNEKECRRKVLAKAYDEAKNQAEAIAEAAGKTLTKCVKVDFKPFTTSYLSEGDYGRDFMCAEKAAYGAARNIVNTFTPEDITITETLYCLWISE